MLLDGGAEDRNILAGSYAELNPAGIQREIQALTGRLLKITTSKAAPAAKPPPQATGSRASANESTAPATRAS